MIETIQEGKTVYAILLRQDYHKPGITFVTENHLSQQLGYFELPAGYKIQPHLHREVKREILDTREVLFIRKGRVKVRFYREDQSHLMDREIATGDCILLIDGGHGFEFLEPTEMIEVKQGPYVNVSADKVRFNPEH